MFFNRDEESHKLYFWEILRSQKTFAQYDIVFSFVPPKRRRTSYSEFAAANEESPIF